MKAEAGLRALVLGSGGVTGVGWELGLLAGLREQGLDLMKAEVLVGTSAGAIVAALLATGVDLEAAYARQLASPEPASSARPGLGQVARFLWAVFGGARTHAAYVARMGRLALATQTVSQAERLQMVRSLLPGLDWPERDLRLTAVDVESGELTVFTRSSGVSLPQAVAASCGAPAVWPPILIHGRHYMDGAVHSLVNLHLAAGLARAVALAPIRRGLGPAPTVQSQADALVGAGTRVAVVQPDAHARRVIGRNNLDPGRRAAAARSGRAQAAAELAALRAVWLD